MLLILALVLLGCSICNGAVVDDQTLSRVRSAVSAFKRKVIDLYDEGIEARMHGHLQPDEAVEALKRKFLKAFVRKPKKFVFGFTGDSVAAGHDCKGDEAYPIQVKNYFGPILESAGIEFEVRNVAVGDNPCFPYNFCVRSYIGEDCDIVSWDQSMSGHSSSSICVENMIQFASEAKSKPIFLITSGSPAIIPRISADRSKRFILGTNEYILKKYGKAGTHWMAPVEALFGLEDDERFSQMQLMGIGKTGKARWWHPGPYGHQVTSIFLASHYTDVFMEAFEEASKVKALEDLPYWSEDTSDLAEAKDLMLEGAKKHLQCSLMYEPHFGSNALLLDLVHPSTFVKDTRDAILSKKKKKKYWNPDRWNIDAVSDRVRNGMIAGMLNGIKDLKFGLVGNNSSGPLTFQLESIEKQSTPFYICGSSIYSGESFPASMDVYADGKLVELSQNVAGCVGPSDHDFTEGVHNVTVKAKSVKGVFIHTLIWWSSKF